MIQDLLERMRPKILIVDDDTLQVREFVDILGGNYQLTTALNGKEALEQLKIHHPDLVLLDIGLPDIDGYEICRQIKQDEETRDILVLFVTAKTEEKDEQKGFSAGGNDFIKKPFSPYLLQARMENLLSLRREERRSDDIIIWASRISELRDDYTPRHQERVAIISPAIAQAMGDFGKEEIIFLKWVASMHDIGKLRVPTELLNKRGKLYGSELGNIQEVHVKAGAEAVLKMPGVPEVASEIIMQHHERLNGSGYPNKLKGKEIHIFARIIAVADLIDAMSSPRPYRERETPGLNKALQELKRQVGVLYDTKVVSVVLELDKKGWFEDNFSKGGADDYVREPLDFNKIAV